MISARLLRDSALGKVFWRASSITFSVKIKTNVAKDMFSSSRIFEEIYFGIRDKKI